MPSLTVTEKEHWKDRIARRIDKKIETLAARNANLLDRVDNDARDRALQSLGLTELQAELDTVEGQREALDRRERQAHRAMLASVRGVPVEAVDDCWHHSSLHQEVSNAVRRRQSVHEEELLAEDPVGQQILRCARKRRATGYRLASHIPEPTPRTVVQGGRPARRRADSLTTRCHEHHADRGLDS